MLQRPLLSYHLSFGSLFCLFLSGRFTQVLLYSDVGREPAFADVGLEPPLGP